MIITKRHKWEDHHKMEYMYIYTSRIKITKIKPQNLSERIKEIFTKYQAPLLKV